MTVLGRTAAGTGESASFPGVDPESLRRCLLLAIPIALSVALLVATLYVYSGLQYRGVSSTRAPAADPGVNQTPSADGLLAPAFTAEVRYWNHEILRWSEETGLDATLIATVMQIESCGDPTAVSPAGARGLFQVMLYHFAAGEDPLDPETNARRGLAYLAGALAQAGGRVDLALAGYNGGHGVITWPMAAWPDETRRYVSWGVGILRDIELGPAAEGGLSAWLAAGGSRLCSRAAVALGITG